MFLKNTTQRTTLAAITTILISGCSSPLKYEPRGQGVQSSSVTGVKQIHTVGSSTCGQSYQIKAGDTLSGIAQKCGVSQSVLAQVNDISRPDKIFIGQLLNMPKAMHPITPTLKETTRYEGSSVRSSSEIHSFSQNAKWSWPTKHKEAYRWIRDKSGVNSLVIYGVIGDGIHAVADGEVVYASDGIREFGQMIMVRHADGKLSVYAHNNRLKVKEGDRVKRGQSIAILGASGMTAEPKLHLEARYQGKKVDIRPLIQSP